MNRNLPSDKKAVYFDANGNKCKKIDFIKNGATGKFEMTINKKLETFNIKNGLIDLSEFDKLKDNPLYIKMQNGATGKEVRNYNFDKTYKKLSELWVDKDNRPTIVDDYMKSHNINKVDAKIVKKMLDSKHLNLTIHECIDGRIMLIDKTIHSKITHIGAVSYYNQSSAMPEILRDYYGSTVTKTLSVTAQKTNYYKGK